MLSSSSSHLHPLTKIFTLLQAVSNGAMIACIVFFSMSRKEYDIQLSLWAFILSASIASVICSLICVFLSTRLLKEYIADDRYNIIFYSFISAFFCFMSWSSDLTICDNFATIIVLISNTISIIIQLCTAVHFITILFIENFDDKSIEKV